MSEEHTIHTIVTALNETDEWPRGQIAAVVRTLGEEAALALLVEANEIERAGGMMLPDGSRRRTPGGVFFTLARRRLTPEDRDAIFPKTPPLRDAAHAAQEPAPKKPDRRHVRLISAGQPQVARVKPAVAGVTAFGAAELPIAGESQPSSIGGAREPSTEEVKLVRLERRRIIQLPPLDASEPPDDTRRRRTRPANDRAQNGAPAGLDAAQVRKRLAAFLEELEISERRLVLLDMLAELDHRKPVAGWEGKVESDLRERVLAAVGNRLGISVGQLALTIFGADTPTNRRRVKALTSELENN